MRIFHLIFANVLIIIRDVYYFSLLYMIIMYQL